MKLIGILCPSEEELAPFLPKLGITSTEEHAGLQFHFGTVGTMPVVALFSGVGKVNAALAAELLIERYRVCLVLLSGTAGGIVDDIRPMDVILSDACAYHDVAPDILTEYHPYFPSVFLPSDRTLLAAAESAAKRENLPARTGRIVTGDAFVEGDARERIRATFSPLAVDMESAAVAHVCMVNKCPFLVVRAVTDTAEEGSHDDFEENCAAASALAARVCLSTICELSHDFS